MTTTADQPSDDKVRPDRRLRWAVVILAMSAVYFLGLQSPSKAEVFGRCAMDAQKNGAAHPDFDETRFISNCMEAAGYKFSLQDNWDCLSHPRGLVDNPDCWKKAR